MKENKGNGNYSQSKLKEMSDLENFDMNADELNGDYYNKKDNQD